MDAMNKLLDSGILSDVTQEGDIIDVTVSPAGEVGSFSEEERSRQVSLLYFSLLFYAQHYFIFNSGAYLVFIIPLIRSCYVFRQYHSLHSSL